MSYATDPNHSSRAGAGHRARLHLVLGGTATGPAPSAARRGVRTTPPTSQDAALAEDVVIADNLTRRGRSPPTTASPVD